MYRIKTLAGDAWYCDNQVLIPDQLLGYRAFSGDYNIKMVNKSGLIEFRTQVGDDGFRLTRGPRSSNAFNSKLFIFGNSYDYGWGVNNEQSYPWILQELLSRCDVRNFGVNAYSNGHNLRLLMHLIDSGSIPDCVVMSYSRKQRFWNVASPSFMNRIFLSGIFPEGSNYYRAGILEDGAIYLDSVPINTFTCGSVQHRFFDADVFYCDFVTQSIFSQANSILGTIPKFIITYDNPDNIKKSRSSFAEQGWGLIDGYLEASSEFFNLPADGHLNPRGHQVIAERILKAIKNHL